MSKDLYDSNEKKTKNDKNSEKEKVSNELLKVITLRIPTLKKEKSKSSFILTPKNVDSIYQDKLTTSPS